MRFGAFSSHSKQKIGAVKMRTFGCDASSSAILNLVSSHDAKFRRKEPFGMILERVPLKEGKLKGEFLGKKSAKAFNTRSKK